MIGGTQMADSTNTLSIVLQGDATNAIESLKALSKTLKELKSAGSGLDGIRALSIGIGELATSANKLNDNKIRSTLKLCRGLSKLNEMRISRGLADSVSKIAAAFLNFQRVKSIHISPIIKSILQLSELKGLNLGTIAKNIERLSKVDMSSTAKYLKELAMAIKPLNANMGNVALGFSSMAKCGNQFVRQANKMAGGTRRNNKQLGVFSRWLKRSRELILLYSGAMIGSTRAITNFASKSMNFVENLNLFDVSMGKSAASAREFAEKVQDLMGIDMSSWVRQQGVFQQILTGFGLTNESATVMSKNLTQLSYDAASLFNLPIEEASRKFQSGIAGELEPLRRIGYALDEATLKHVALSNGIEGNIRDMTQSEKAYLRYLAIMEQSKNAMGDMARTIDTPANSMRILGLQLEQLGRSVGNVLIPILSSILPYLQAIVELAREAFEWVANLLGFELPKIDYSGVSTGVGKLGDAAEQAGGAMDNVGNSASKAKEKVKEFRNYLLSFDEMHVIPSTSKDENQSAGGSGGGKGLGGRGRIKGFEKLKLPEYDFLKGLKSKLSGIKEKLAGIRRAIGEAKDFIVRNWKAILALGIGVAILRFHKQLFKLIEFIPKLRGLSKVKDFFSKKWFDTFGVKFNEVFDRGKITTWGTNAKAMIMKVGISLVALAGETILVKDGFYRIGREGKSSLTGIIEVVSGITVAGAAMYAMWGPAGLLVAGIVAVGAAIAGLKQARYDNLMDTYVGRLRLTTAEAKELGRVLATTDFSMKINKLTTQTEEVERAFKNSISALEKYSSMKYRLSLGFKVDTEEIKNVAKNVYDTAQTYMNERSAQLKLAIDLNAGGNSPKWVQQIYDGLQTDLITKNAELHALGVKLNDIINNGFKDGEMLPDTQSKIDEVVSKIRAMQLEIQRRIDSEKWEALKLRLEFEAGNAGEKLDVESIKNTMKEVFDNIKESMRKEAESSAYDSKMVLEKFGTDVHEAFKEHLYRKMIEHTMPQVEEGLKFMFGKMTKEFGDGLGKIQELCKTGFYGLVSTMGIVRELKMPEINFGSANTDKLAGWFSDVESTISKGHKFLEQKLRTISPDLYETVTHYWEQLKPQAEQIGKLIADIKRSGQRIPDTLRKVMTDYSNIRMLNDAGYAQAKAIADGISSKEGLKALMKFPEAIKKMSIAAKTEFLGNFNFDRDAAGKIVSLKSTITGEVIKMTPELETVFREAGLKMGGALNKSQQEELEKTLRKLKELKDGTIENAKNVEEASEKFGQSTERLSKDLQNSTAEMGEAVSESSKLIADKMDELNLIVPRTGESVQSTIRMMVEGINDQWGNINVDSLSARVREMVRNGTIALEDFKGDFISAMRRLVEEAVGEVNGITLALQKAFRGMANLSKNEMVYSSRHGTTIEQRIPGTKWGMGPTFSQFATGGFPTSGELYMANENGESEYIGRVGSKAAVANNDQIVESISKAVFDAMMNAKNENDSKGDYLQINIDGTTKIDGFIKEIKRKNQRAGKIIIPVEV